MTDTNEDAAPGEEDQAASAPSTALAAIDKARDAAKWLVAGFAAVAAVLVAGTQLSSIGSVEDPRRLAVAAACAVVGLGALAIALFASYRLMAPATLSLEGLAARNWAGRDPAIKFLRDNPSAFLGAASDPTELRDRRNAAYLAEDRTRAALASGRPTDAERRAAREATRLRVELERAVASVVEWAAQATFQGQLRRWEWTVGVSTAVVGLALVGFAWAANPPEDGEGASPSLSGVHLEGVDLSGSDLGGIDFSGATFSDVNLRGATTKGADFSQVVWDDVTCVDGTNSDDAGNTCAGHLGE